MSSRGGLWDIMQSYLCSGGVRLMFPPISSYTLLCTYAMQANMYQERGGEVTTDRMNQLDFRTMGQWTFFLQRIAAVRKRARHQSHGRTGHSFYLTTN